MCEKRWAGQVKVEILKNGKALVYVRETNPFCGTGWYQTRTTYSTEADGVAMAETLYQNYLDRQVAKVVE